jgi:hypothetical protein
MDHSVELTAIAFLLNRISEILLLNKKQIAKQPEKEA